MYYNNDVKIFLNKLEESIQGELSRSTIDAYLQRVKKLLKSGYSVSDLCGGVDQLIEEYSPSGNKYDKNDHGTTKAALKKVRIMVKGDILSSFSVSFCSASVSKILLNFEKLGINFFVKLFFSIDSCDCVW